MLDLIRRLFPLIALALLAAACAPGIENAGPDANVGPAEVTMYVAPETVPCEGVGPQTCLQIRYSPDEPWQLFYADIAGFEYEPGFNYELRVAETPVDNPPADGSSIAYRLVSVESKVAAAEVALPTEEADDVTRIVLDQTAWQLVAYGPEGAMQPLPEGVEVTIRFGPDGFEGLGGCNSYFGSYTLDGASLTLSEIGATMMACDDPAMRVETEYLAALGAVSAVSRDMVEMTLTAGDTLLRYEPLREVPTVSLEGVTWVLDSFIDGDVVSTPLAGTTLTLEFVDGGVSGNAGCNNYFGTYRTDMETIEIGPLASTRMACPDVMEQEAAFLQRLEAMTLVELDGRTLTLTNPTEGLRFTAQDGDFVPAPEPQPVEEIIRGEAAVDTVTVAVMESFPVQVSATVEGNLPDGCTEVDSVTAERVDETTFVVTVTTVRPRDAMCTQALVPYSETVTLDVLGLPAGNYTVRAGDAATSFELAGDNAPPEATEDAPPAVNVIVDTLDIDVAVRPTVITVVITGHLPDGCSRIVDETVTRAADDLFDITLNAVRDEGACITVLTPFTHTVTIDGADLESGRYRLAVHGVEGWFELEL